MVRFQLVSPPGVNLAKTTSWPPADVNGPFPRSIVPPKVMAQTIFPCPSTATGTGSVPPPNPFPQEPDAALPEPSAPLNFETNAPPVAGPTGPSPKSIGSQVMPVNTRSPPVVA